MDNKQIVLDNLLEQTAKDIYDIDKGDFTALKIAAQDFLSKVDYISDLYEKGLKEKSIRTKIRSLYRAMREETSYTRNMLQLAHEFERAVNNFIGRKIYLTYVKEDGSFIFYDDANIGKLYAQATANRGRGNISQGKIFDANDLQKNLQKEIDKSIKNRNKVYKEAVERWQSNKNEGTKDYNISKKTFYWRLHDAHSISGWTNPIATKGIIAEGYAGAVINEDPQVVNSAVEPSLKRLWENHIHKDSVGALVKGDVVMERDGSIQFAVKEGSFSTAMIGQYVNLAYNIVRLRPLTIKELEDNLPNLIKLSKAAENTIKSLNEDVEELLSEEIQKAIK